MLGFTYYTPTKVAFGKGSVERVGELMKQFGGTRVLIHYGGQSAVRSGVLDRVKKSLDEAGIFHVELGGVVPNPHLAKVREGRHPHSRRYGYRFGGLPQRRLSAQLHRHRGPCGHDDGL